MTGVVELMQGVIKAARVDRGLEMNQLEQRAWLGELIAFDGMFLSLVYFRWIVWDV